MTPNRYPPEVKEPCHDGRDSYVETRKRCGCVEVVARLAVLERIAPGAYVAVRDAVVETDAAGRAVLVVRVEIVGPPPAEPARPPRKPGAPQFDGC